jgi:hypothetical protein
MRHPYLHQFFNPKDEPLTRPIKPDVSDNVKLTVKDYKQLIYQWIKEHYREPEGLEEKGFVRDLARQVTLKEEFDKKPRLKKSESLKGEKGFQPYSTYTGKLPESPSLQKSFSGLLKKEQPYTAQSFSSKKYSSFLDKRDSRPSSTAYLGYHEKDPSKSVSDLLKRIEGRHRPGIAVSSKPRK